MDGERRRFDVFLCYSWADSDAGAALREALEAEDLKVFQDVVTGEVYEPLGESIRQALDDSRTLVALMTPHLSGSPHCREELHVALSAAAHLDDGDTSRVLAVVQDLSPDDVRPRELTRLRLPRAGTPPAELAREIGKAVRRHEGVFGDAPKPPPLSWYPREMAGDRRFRGRWDELWDIRHGLSARFRNADRGHPVVVVDGPGGLGKTALCLQYGRWFPHDHPGGVFLFEFGGSAANGALGDSAVRSAFRRQLPAIARKLKLTEVDQIAPALAAGDSYLWILDDLPAGLTAELITEMCAPTANGRTLISTRGRIDTPASATVTLTPLDPIMGGRALTSRRSAADEEKPAVRDIVQLLGGHPLGLALASALTALPDFAGYRRLFAELSSSEPDRLEAVAAGLVDELPAGCARPFANALLRSFGSLPAATREALTALSVLGPTYIPYALVNSLTEGSTAARSLGPAADGGLVIPAGTDGCVMHALTARAIRIQVYPAAVRDVLRDAALRALTAAVERTRESYKHSEVADHLPHVRAVTGLLPGGDSWAIGPDERYLLNESGRTQIEAGHGDDALELLTALHEACGTGSDVDAVTRHAVAVSLAAAHTDQGNHTIALDLLDQAVDALASEPDADELDVLTARNNLALAHLAVGRHDRAHDLLRQVYTARRRHRRCGPQHRETLKALNNLAIARGHLGTTAAERGRARRVAHRYWLAAHERWRRVAGPDDQYALDVLNGLGLSYRTLGLNEQAFALLDELCRRRERLLGAEHPDTLSAAENALITRCDLGESPVAGFQAVLLGRLRRQKPGHPAIGVTMANLIRTARRPLDRSQPAERLNQPVEFAPSGVRLDGDHVDAELDLQALAIDYQQECVDRFGEDDVRALMAAGYLAYSLAADHFYGQLEGAHEMMEHTWPGLADAADTGLLSQDEREIAGIIRDWLREQVGDYET
ncbi:tetratricopeptide repeat protein [Amycolatopsis sp. NPDC004378]